VSSGGAGGGAPSPGFEEVPLEELRRRRSVKWTQYPPEVLPAFVAEMDFALAPPIRQALVEAVEIGDTGYPQDGRIASAFAAFAASRFGWEVEPARVRTAPDVMTAVAELVRGLSEPGDGVVVNPPIYPPFRSVTAELGRRLLEAPLARAGDGSFRLDLELLEQRFAAGARVYLLCHPHNPSGHSFAREELAGIARLAERYGVTVVCDEIHAPLTLPGASHVPYLSLGGEAVEHGVTVAGASKAFNLAGLKCALIVTGSERMDARLQETLSPFLRYHVGHLGVLASLVAFEQGQPWLAALVAHLDENRRRLASLLAEALPELGYVPPEAGYLAWLDCRALELGDDPAAAFLERGGVALSSGPTFGVEGTGFARLNFGTSGALLAEAVRRLALAAGR
jgi:cysteine-S-conjugate beta-lyase